MPRLVYNPATMNWVPGLVSVSFRPLSVPQIVELASRAQLQAIEWGGDVHVPPGDLNAAKNALRNTSERGLKVNAYGSYYRVAGAEADFSPVFESALALEVKQIRVWAGNVWTRDASAEHRKNIVNDLRRICELSAKAGVTIAMEFHDGTLNDSAEQSVWLINEVRAENLRTYWQPRHGFSIEANLQQLKLVKPYLADVHVFHWWPTHETRWPLAAGAENWAAYLREVSAGSNRTVHAMLEFVKGDDAEQLDQDSRTLRELLSDLGR